MNNSTYNFTDNELQEVIDTLKKVGYTSHHTALARKYIRKDNGRLYDYHGVFGCGYVIEYPNSLRNCSNRYHVIEYLLK